MENRRLQDVYNKTQENNYNDFRSSVKIDIQIIILYQYYKVTVFDNIMNILYLKSIKNTIH